MHTLSIDEIETLASHHGACKSEVERFLDTVGRTGTLESELLDMYYDARSWLSSKGSSLTLKLSGLVLSFMRDCSPKRGRLYFLMAILHVIIRSGRNCIGKIRPI